MSFLKNYLIKGNKIFDLFTDTRSKDINKTEGRTQFVSDYLRVQNIMNEDKGFFLEQLILEINAKLVEIGANEGIDELSARRLGFAGDMHEKLATESPAFIHGSTIEEVTNCFYKYLDHVEKIWHDAIFLFERESYYSAKFLAIICIEEVAKVDVAWQQLILLIMNDFSFPHLRIDTRRAYKDHNVKHIKSILQSLVMNDRVMKIFDNNQIDKLLKNVENKQLENIRQNSIYFDAFDKNIAIPSSKISKKDALFYVAIAGEVMVDVVVDPRERERVLNYVVEFERVNGIIKT